jgi:hypothetical protein
MPIQRDNITNTPAQQYRPGTGDDGLGNPIPGTDVFLKDVRAGVIPGDIRRDPYKAIGGGNINLLKWLLIVRGYDTFKIGDAVVVLEGIFAGKYRAEILEQVPSETFLLAQCIKES